ncbi:DUF1183-domain-containing protein [Mycena sanguinolenta]|uniref:Store-operated calcium entry-associated regulatory factor n=1 Tax=Mycena sanguinolenta TaxID=230812 RepID=A0A8H6ZBZ4_9AGAR|nr:DUF1183-domain-containing protein [Mycena sanguinolenta]
MSRVELAKIPALTFYKDSVTEGRRTSPISQLVCVGEPCPMFTSARPTFHQVYDLVELKLAARDGRDLATDTYWQVRCMLFYLGLLSPIFRFVFARSTGWCECLEACVTVIQTIGLAVDPTTPVLWFFMFIWLAFVAIIVYSFFQSCMRGPQNQAGARPDRPRPGNSGYFPGSFPGGYNNDDASAPPPPYSKGPPTANNEGWRPGFWTGAALGGLGAHFLGNRQNQNSREYDWERRQTARSPPSSGFFGPEHSATLPEPGRPR